MCAKLSLVENRKAPKRFGAFFYLGVYMRRVILPALMLWTLGFTGCTGDNGKQLFETAQFEEKQHNLEHAKQLYEEISRKYPDSDYGKKAAVRLGALKAEGSKQ